MLKFSNFLELENFIIFKEKCLSFKNDKVWDFIASTESIIIDKNLTIEEQVRNILGYIISDLSILDFLLSNIFDYDEEVAMSIKYFMEEPIDSSDRQTIFETLISNGITSMKKSQTTNNNKIFENICNDLVEGNQDHLIKDNIVYFIEGNFLICYNALLEGFNFEYNNKSYKEISDLLNLNKTPIIDNEYTIMLFQYFNFTGDWLEDIHSITEAHYKEFGEEHEHSNIYGDLPIKLEWFENSDDNTWEAIFNRFGYLIKTGFNLMDNVFFNDNEKAESEFNLNYPFNISFDDLLMESNYYFNQIYLNYLQKFDQNKIDRFDKTVNDLNNYNNVISITNAKENFHTELVNYANLIDMIGFKDIEYIVNKYFNFEDSVSEERFNKEKFIELMKMFSYKENESLSVWKDSYLTLK